jgi:hypothetical protein
MRTLQKQEIKVNAQGIKITKSTYYTYNDSLKRNTFITKWTTEFKGKFGRGYSMKEAIENVMRKIK